MRGYIFTALERRILNNYLRKGRKVGHFDSLATKIRRNDQFIQGDLKLIETCKRKNKALFTRGMSMGKGGRGRGSGRRKY